MGYLIKSEVMSAIEEDMKSTLMVYEDRASKDIVRHCYEWVYNEIDKLPQYRLENVGRIN